MKLTKSNFSNSFSKTSIITNTNLNYVYALRVVADYANAILKNTVNITNIIESIQAKFSGIFNT